LNVRVANFTLSVTALLIALAAAQFTHAARQSRIAPGAYRIDVNGKVRELCVDEIGLKELNANGWKARLSEQGVRCALSNIRGKGAISSWTGTCAAPGMGKIFETRHDVSVKISDDGSFDVLTLLSGDLQARIPVRGERLSTGATGCSSHHDTFRPWQ
jgi:hypothetical protein